MLVFLFFFYVVGSLDRYIIALALPTIGAEFDLNDIELGLLSGMAFSLVFAVSVMPLNVLLSGIDRRHVIACSVFLWSAMTVASGFVLGFVQLLAVRIGIGVAVAAGVPAAHVTVSEHYGDDERTGAFGMLIAGAAFGISLALIGGGGIIHFYGWRNAMILAGLPGLVLAAIGYMVLPSIRSAHHANEAGVVGRTRAAAAELSNNRLKRLIFFGIILTSIINFGTLLWLPTFLVRAHGLSTMEVGLYIAVAVGLGNSLGTASIGRLADRLGQRDPAWRPWLPALLMLIVKPAFVVGLLTPHTPLALGLMTPALLVGGAHTAAAYARLHDGVDGAMRGTLSSVTLLGTNLIGQTLGPLIVGGVSVALGAADSGSSLGYGLATLQAISFAGLTAYFMAGLEARRCGAGHTAA